MLLSPQLTWVIVRGVKKKTKKEGKETVANDPVDICVLVSVSLCLFPATKKTDVLHHKRAELRAWQIILKKKTSVMTS